MLTNGVEGEGSPTFLRSEWNGGKGTMHSISCIYRGDGPQVREAYDFVTAFLRGMSGPLIYEAMRKPGYASTVRRYAYAYDEECGLFNEIWAQGDVSRLARNGTSSRATYIDGGALPTRTWIDYWGVVQDTPEAFRWNHCVGHIPIPMVRRPRPPVVGTRCIEFFYAWYRNPMPGGFFESTGYQNYEKFRQFRTLLEAHWALSAEHRAMPFVSRFFGKPEMF